MLDRLQQLKERALNDLARVQNTAELESWRVAFFGKKAVDRNPQGVGAIAGRGAPVSARRQTASRST